jgi:hypothetical protein
MFDSLVDFLWTARPSLFSGTGRFYGVRPLLAVDYDWNKFTARARLMTELNFHFSTSFDYNIGMFKDRVVIHNDVYNAIVVCA